MFGMFKLLDKQQREYLSQYNLKGKAKKVLKKLTIKF